MSSATPVPRRHALGWPAGSVRATHLLVITIILTLVLVIPDRNGNPLPFPAYLVYLLFLMIGHYFAARGHGGMPGERSPLWLPRGFIRLVVVASLGAALGYRIYTDYPGLERQLADSLQRLTNEPMLPLFILLGFLVGNLLRSVVGRNNPAAWLQDVEAWLSLIGLLGLGISAVVHLIINPSMETPIEMPRWDQVMATLVAFYFGARS